MISSVCSPENNRDGCAKQRADGLQVLLREAPNAVGRAEPVEDQNQGKSKMPLKGTA